MESIRIELLERYRTTGKVGFTKPKSIDEALDLINAVTNLYDNKQEIVYNLSDITNKLKYFFEK